MLGERKEKYMSLRGGALYQAPILPDRAWRYCYAAIL
jgi:hypothetical protein